MQIVLATVFKQAQSYIDSNGLAGMKAKSSIQILFFEKQAKYSSEIQIFRKGREPQDMVTKKHKTR